MNSAVGFNFKEKIAKFYTYKSYEQYTWPIKKKKKKKCFGWKTRKMRFPNRGKINNQETNHDGLTQPVKGWK